LGNLIRQYVHPKQLDVTPQGFKMSCPYHSPDRHPSFHISLEKGHCKCFSCGEYRNIFSFLTEHGVPFDEAIEYFFEEYAGSGRVLEPGIDFILGTKIPKSMIDRGFEVKTIQHFKSGYDDVEDRITIPMLYNDLVYGVKYRRHPKQLWYSENFVKEHFIYNYAPTEERTYVEGEGDTWMVWQNGTKEVSAILGSEITEEQERLMMRHKVINIATDNDMAGYKAAFQIHDRLKMDVDIFYVPYNRKDPADDLGKGTPYTPDEWQAFMKDKKSFVEFELAFQDRYKKEYYEILRKLKNR
jgi:DNA primase